MLHHLENHIENMRQKPEHVKRQYALGVSLCITLIIFGFWMAARRPDNENFAERSAAPVKALTASASDAFDYVKGLIVGGNKLKYDSPAGSENIEVVPGKI